MSGPAATSCAEQGETGGIYCFWGLQCLCHREMIAEELLRLFNVLPPPSLAFAENANYVSAQSEHRCE